MRQTDARLKCCIAVTNTDKIYMYTSLSTCTIVESARERTKIWSGWQEMNETLLPKEMIQLSINLGIRLEFTKGSKEDLSMELWDQLCRRANDRRSAVAPIVRHAITGKKLGRRKQDLSSRRYIITDEIRDLVKLELRKDCLNHCPCTTRQAQRIWVFFVDEYLATGSRIVTEGRMQNIVNDRAEELNTKQDPWRIFQYYRPELIDCQLIKLEK